MAEQVKLVVLADVDEALSIIETMTREEIGGGEGLYYVKEGQAGIFGDNGGECDGNADMRPAAELPAEVLAALVAAGAAQIVEGWYEKSYNGSDAEQERMAEYAEEWSGYGADGKLFYLADEPAPALVEEEEDE